MPKKNPLYTDLTLKGALRLEIDKVVYEVTQYASSWAANEIPNAVCALAVGRNARTDKKATIHANGLFKQMTEARVLFTPFGDFSQDSEWPAGSRVIFDGFFVGFTRRKINGKMHVIANLVHWLAALGCSSAVTKLGHVANPTSLNSAAVLCHPDFTGAGLGNYISATAVSHLAGDDFTADLWGAIKSIFCGLASIPTMVAGREGECGGEVARPGLVGPPISFVNDFALQALSRMEGPGGNCAMPYKYGVPLQMDTLGIAHAGDAIGQAIGQETVESWAATTFWDKLVAQYCPAFGMAVVPMVDRALVIADTPALQAEQAPPWKTLDANQYDADDMSSALDRPLRAVGVIASYESPTQAGLRDGDALPITGGCFVADSVKAGDGATMFVAAPPWLRSLQFQPVYAGGPATGILDELPGPSSTTPMEELAGIAFGVNAGELYNRYARTVYVNHTLRGRGGSISGKLRFDIAPCSLIRLLGSTEKFIGGEDDLALTQFATVTRVTFAINAEAGQAGTTFGLSHVRNEQENKDPRTSVIQHPLFGDAIHGNGRHGAPIVPDYDLR